MNKYNITEEELNELKNILDEDMGHSAHYIRTEIKKNLLPHLFSLKLKVGEWYEHSSGQVFYCTEIDEEGNMYGYGWDNSGKWSVWKPNDENICACNSTVALRLSIASKEQIEGYFTGEAIKRGFKTGADCYWKDKNITHYNLHGEFKYDFEGEHACIGIKVIYHKGEWAEIIPKEDIIILNGIKYKKI